MVNPANREEYARWLDACEKARDMYDDWCEASTLEEFDRLYVDWIGYSRVSDDPGVTLESIRDCLFGYLIEFCSDAGVDSSGYVNPFEG